MEKMTSIMIEQNNIISKIEKLKPQDGDVLIFYGVTDQWGDLLTPVYEVLNFLDGVKRGIANDNVGILFLPDKICLSEVTSVEEAKEELKRWISYLQKAMDKVVDIENRKFEKFRDVAEDQTKGSH